MKIVDALLASTAAPRIRELLGLTDERTFTELAYVRAERIEQTGGTCDVLICLAKFVEGALAENAVDIALRFSAVSYIDWHSAFRENRPGLAPGTGHLAFDLDDFRIVAAGFEVRNIVPYKLGSSVAHLLEPNRSIETAPGK